MQSRREFLRVLPAAAVAAGVCLHPLRAARAARVRQDLAAWPGTAEAIATDEAFWFEVAQAYTVDRSLVNLNNGGTSPSPAVVQAAVKRHLDAMNAAPPSHALWRVQQPQREGVRTQLARAFGCDAEELALTRNASEGLQICQFGFDLEAGDEVLTTDRDYPRMLTTFRQRERREGIRPSVISLRGLDEDPDGIVARIGEHITPRTRMVLISHVVFLNGQILPAARIVAMARERGVPVIVDGAHSLAHLDFKLSDLACDYFAASLHKWLCAPHGTGLLYVRRERIGGLWPLMAAEAKQDADIRKFEEIGTHPEAAFLAIAEALAFHLGIGPERKETRLLYLRDYWAKQLLEHDRVRLHTSLKPGMACGIACFGIEGVDSGALSAWLWNRHRILTTTVKHPDFEGVRVTPNVYTRLEELDRFVDCVEHVLKHGLGAEKAGRGG
ncbi:MAG: aminotransferase class V-fold PLP-dependent enzyme [Planctomycetes bacterium]|nr:aminotransferase class V-fold PLP-dependent enzyme [Planctomycetota bacterium]